MRKSPFHVAKSSVDLSFEVDFCTLCRN